MTNGEADKVCDVMEFELFHHICAMCLYCFDAQYQTIGYLLIDETFCYQNEVYHQR